MARIFEPAPQRQKPNYLLAMRLLRIHQVNEHYNNSKKGLTVNDGKFLKVIDDKEEVNSESNKDNN